MSISPRLIEPMLESKSPFQIDLKGLPYFARKDTTIPRGVACEVSFPWMDNTPDHLTQIKDDLNKHWDKVMVERKTIESNAHSGINACYVITVEGEDPSNKEQ